MSFIRDWLTGPKKIYIRLEEIHFKALIKGKEIVIDDLRDQAEVHVILEDMGFDHIRYLVSQGIKESLWERSGGDAQ